MHVVATDLLSGQEVLVSSGDLVAAVCEYLDLPHARAYPFATGISDWDRVASVCAAFRPTVVFMAPGVAPS